MGRAKRAIRRILSRATGSGADRTGPHGPYEHVEVASLTDEPVAPGFVANELYRLKERRFPVLTDPDTVPTGELAMGEDAWVVGLAGDWGARAYPVSALGRHHIINDTVDAPVLVTFCIMCSSGLCFDPVIDSERLVFDVFGHYRRNMAMDDEKTGTVWSQMDGSAIVGELVGRSLTWIPSETMSFGQWLQRHPDSRTPATMNRGQRSDLKTLGLSHGAPHDGRLVLGVVVDGVPVSYPVDGRTKRPRVVVDSVGGLEIVILADSGAMPAVFRRHVGDQVLEFEVSKGRIVGGGSTWSGGGLALDGPFAGQRLDVIPSRATQSLQWQSFHPDSEVRRLRAPGR